MLKTLIIATFSIVLLGCELMGDCTKVNIPKDERLWYSGYKKPKKILLKSDLGKFDTLKLINVESSFTPCNKFELGEFQYEECTIELYSNLMKEEIFFSYYASKSNKQKGYIGFDNSQINFYSKDINKRATKIYCKYKNDSLIGHVLSYPDANSNTIKTAFWSKEFGIIEYETGSGEKFEVMDIKY